MCGKPKRTQTGAATHRSGLEALDTLLENTNAPPNTHTNKNNLKMQQTNRHETKSAESASALPSKMQEHQQKQSQNATDQQTRNEVGGTCL